MTPCFARIFFALLFLSTFVHAAEIPFRMQNGLIVVEIKSEAMRWNFVVDTGAEATVIDFKSAAAAGLRIGRSETVVGAHGRSQGAWINGFTAALGQYPLPGKVLAFNLRALAGGIDFPIDGLIGADFFANRIVRIDYRRRILNVLDPTVGMRGESVRLHRRGRILGVEASVNGSPAGWVRLDTGCVEAMRWCGPSARARGGRDTSIAVSSGSLPGRCASVQLDGRSVGEIPLAQHSQPIFAGEAGLLGNGFLSRFVVTIDVRGQRLYLE